MEAVHLRRTGATIVATLRYEVSNVPDIRVQFASRMMRPDRARVDFDQATGETTLRVSGPWVIHKGLSRNRATNFYIVGKADLTEELAWIVEMARRDLDAQVWSEQ